MAKSIAEFVVACEELIRSLEETRDRWPEYYGLADERLHDALVEAVGEVRAGGRLAPGAMGEAGSVGGLGRQRL